MFALLKSGFVAAVEIDLEMQRDEKASGQRRWVNWLEVVPVGVAGASSACAGRVWDAMCPSPLATWGGLITTVAVPLVTYGVLRLSAPRWQKRWVDSLAGAFLAGGTQ